MINILNFIHRFKKITIYRFKNMNIKIYTLCTFFLCAKENCRKMTISKLLITIIKSIKKLIKK